RQVDRMRGVVRAGAGDDGGTAVDGPDDAPPEVDLLLVRERRPLAGRARDHEPVAAVVEEPDRQFLGSIQVQRPVLTKRAGHGGDDGAEPSDHGGTSSRLAVCPMLPRRRPWITMSMLR